MRLRRILLFVAIVVIAGLGFLIVRDGVPSLRIATAYAAKQTCSCLFVAGRDLASCQGDYNPFTARWFAWDPTEQAVTVSFAGLISSQATYADGNGCRAAP
ncbi:hypothetical protein [Bauldia sp.]|uniref:hypothetical protein n=1 Tax=Bauldia sp. TaxID=2575872 RepID=UPI003BA8F1FB